MVEANTRERFEIVLTACVRFAAFVMYKAHVIEVAACEQQGISVRAHCERTEAERGGESPHHYLRPLPLQQSGAPDGRPSPGTPPAIYLWPAVPLSGLAASCVPTQATPWQVVDKL